MLGVVTLNDETDSKHQTEKIIALEAKPKKLTLNTKLEG